MSAPSRSRFVCTPLPLHGLVRVQRQPLQDARGLFERMFCTDELAAAGWTQPIAQINHSVTRQRGSVRGLHYQRPPHAEMKLVSCLHGEVWDVAVDVRPDSPTFLQWHAERLSPDNGCALPTLGAEITRADLAVRETAEHGLVRLQQAWGEVLGDPQLAWAVLAQCVGALLVARMLATPQRQEEVLNASRRLLDQQLAGGN